MSKARRISAFFRKILLADPGATVNYSPDTRDLRVWFKSALAKDDVYCENEGIVLESRRIPSAATGEPSYYVRFDCSGMGEEPDKPVTGFTFDKLEKKKARRAVTAQEEEGAGMIGGRRHVGSGALDGLKSDASSKRWQQEAKSTKNQSFGLKLAILDKITREARVADKEPMVFLRFTDPEEGVVAEDDWVIMPRSSFERIEGMLGDG